MGYYRAFAELIQIQLNCKYRGTMDEHSEKRADNRAVCQYPAKTDLVLRLCRVAPSTNVYEHQRISNSNILTVQK